MKAVITVIGKDQVGILSKVSTACYESNANIVDVSQTIMDEYFTMTMMVEVDKLNLGFEEFKEKLSSAVPTMEVHVMHENIFNSMHRI